MQRFWEIDLWRGLALIGMIVFNWSFALYFLNIFKFQGGWLYWSLFPHLIAGSFVFIAGLSLYISHSRRKDMKHVFARGLTIFSLGMLITLATLFLIPQYAVWFGILHLIGLSIILSNIFHRFGKTNLIIGLLIVSVGAMLHTMRFDFPWLFWLGFIPTDLSSLDYEPLLPWFGFFLMGMGFGEKFYKNNKRTFRIRDMSKNRLVRNISVMGRNSLIIYLLHQPLFLTLLFLLGLA